MGSAGPWGNEAEGGGLLPRLLLAASFLLASDPLTFKEIVKRSAPAVVSLRLTEPPEGHPSRPQRTLGSGFFISSDGLIVTNSHVVEGTERVLVRLSDLRELSGRVVGRDIKTDLALIRISGEGLPFLKIADSERLEVGEWVVAVGNPFGLEETATVGVVSALGRAIGTGPYDDFIQTDASINPGNSGGPLLNLKGEVIGINTAINPTAQGIGFAIPGTLAKGVISALMRGGRVVRGWLGVLIQEVTPELKRAFALPSDAGALVSDLLPESPAARAGMERGDVIVEFDGHRVDRMRRLPTIVAGTRVGKEVQVTVLRNGEPLKLKVRIVEMPEG